MVQTQSDGSTFRRAPAVGLWYRSSPRFLVPYSDGMQVSTTDPPLRIAGMTYVDVDAKGALLDFQAVPPQRTPGVAATPADMD